MMDRRVCFIGDSFVLGQGDDDGLGWAGRVHAAARRQGCQLTSYNLGVRRETGADIERRAYGEIGARLTGMGDTRAVVFSFGTNDLALSAGGGLAAAERLLAWTRDQGFAAFLVSPPPSADSVFDARVQQMTEDLAALAEARSVPFLDLRAAIHDWTLWRAEAAAGDGVHPNAGGYVQVAEAFIAWAPWRAWLTGLEP